jgi:hypothetical protein
VAALFREGLGRFPEPHQFTNRVGWRSGKLRLLHKRNDRIVQIKVEGFRDYLLPPKSRMVFDETTGTERLFLVFSREPEPNLDRMIDSLTSNPAASPNQKQAPVIKTLLVAGNSGVDDSTVGLLRSVHSRDLKIEKVDEQTPGENKETAVYVVNPSGGADSRVVADLLLVHQ